MAYPPTLVASASLAGALGVCTAVLTGAIAAGEFPVFICSAAAATGSFVSCTDDNGSAWSVLSFTATNEEMAICWPTALALPVGLNIGQHITATLSAGTPGGRMVSVANYGSGFVLANDQQATANSPASATASATTPALSQPAELVVAMTAMRSVIAGGTDAITVGGPLTQRDNRNHNATTTAYMAWGDNLPGSASPFTASFSFLAADNAGVIVKTFTLQAAPPPGTGSATYAWRPIMEGTVQREGYAGLE